MSTEIFPIIDLSAWDGQRGPKTQEIVQACKAWGFMILTGHGIPQLSIDRMFEMHQDFCKQPLPVKSECTIDERQVGYDLKNSKIGVNEGVVFGGTKGEIEKGRNVPTWWDANKRAEIEDFKSRCHVLGQKLLRVFALSFNLHSDFFSSAHNDEKGPGSVLRMLHYPKLEAQPQQDFPRLYAHTDWGSLTFVWATSGGLEVETPSREWFPVPSVKGGVVVNIGDAMSLWSGKTLKSTLHRISFDNLPIESDRWSMAYFVNANHDARLDILQRVGEDELSRHPDLPTLTAGEYHQARLYMSQREDAKNNWTGEKRGVEIAVRKVVQMVEQLGIANGSGIITMTTLEG